MRPDIDAIRREPYRRALVGGPSAGAPSPEVRGGIVSRRALFERLGRAGRVTQVSAPAGSGKTFLLRSWIDAAGLAESTAWVSVQRDERNPQRFWVSVLSALRQTAAGSAVVRPLTAAPDLDGWAVVERLLTPHALVTPMRAHMLQALVLIGETGQVEGSLAELDPREREGGEMRNVIALLRLAQHDPRGATAALAPVLDGSVRVHPVWLVAAALLEAIARGELGDPDAAWRAVERALDLAEPDRVLFPFLIHPVPALLEHHARDGARHAALVAEILSLPGGSRQPRQDQGSSPRPAESSGLAEPLSQGETRVLRYLPTNLPAPDIARELSVSVNTVRTHIRHVYAKLGAHGRTEAVARARALGLLAPSGRTT